LETQPQGRTIKLNLAESPTNHHQHTGLHCSNIKLPHHPWVESNEDQMLNMMGEINGRLNMMDEMNGRLGELNDKFGEMS
jgi:hypothetical protein